MITDHALLLLPVAVLWPLILAALCLLPRVRPRMIAALPFAPLPALAAAITAPRDTMVALPWLLLDSGLRLDQTSAVFLGGAAVLWFLAGLYAARYMFDDRRAAGFALFWNLVLAGNVGVFLAADAASFYVSFALVSLMAYPLVIHNRKPASLRAGAIYIALAVIGEVALFAALVMGSNAAGGSILIADIQAVLTAPGGDPLILYLLIAGFGIKAGLMPLHVWLPVAHPAAPVPASAVLSGAIVKAGIFGFAAFLPWGTAWPVGGTSLALLGFAGLFAAAFLGVAQNNAKTVLAYSTVSQMGLVMGVSGLALAAGLPGEAVLPAVTLYALHHGLTKGALFLGVGLARTWGGSSRWLLLVLMGLLSLSLAGLPLTAGALAKAALKAPAGVIGAALIGLSALTSGLVLARVVFTLPAPEQGRRPPALMLIAAVALAAAALSAPWLLHMEIAAAIYGSPGDLLTAVAEGWPLGLALVLAATAAATGLRPPQLPEGDLLFPLRWLVLRVTGILQAAVATLSDTAPNVDTSQPRASARNLEKIEAMFSNSAAIAVTFAVISAALLFALQ